jgi:hypothetical protein
MKKRTHCIFRGVGATTKVIKLIIAKIIRISNGLFGRISGST